eukprot:gnl/MRDRNA2_/MRDRNA2_191689_c0_seq1.p1 gnl/MRDRNA2_/MRDRNA2_191689_c0~~gnl/MRDRNA2_/MRDRNA2_191689_c0_seq1.p1  ORF type:complete len:252 (+),score=23.56 gnl/MRDRNA2_/MRDRNA2_191689_c0_seq1:134-889(+)
MYDWRSAGRQKQKDRSRSRNRNLQSAVNNNSSVSGKVCTLWLSGPCTAGMACPDRHPPPQECEMLRARGVQSSVSYTDSMGNPIQMTGESPGGPMVMGSIANTDANFDPSTAPQLPRRSGLPNLQGAGSKKVCPFWLSSTCKANMSCPDRHPPDHECNMLRMEYKNKPCRFGANCQNQLCLYGHDGGSQGFDYEVEEMLDRWVEAKRSRNFSEADQIRADLKARGIRPDAARPHVWEPRQYFDSARGGATS